MSIILDALNRSRTESDPVPGLGSQPVYLEEPVSPAKRWLPWVALAIAVLLILWLVWNRSGDNQSAAETTSLATSTAGTARQTLPAALTDAPKKSVASPPAKARQTAPPPAAPQPAAPPPAAPQQNSSARGGADSAVAKLYAKKPAARPAQAEDKVNTETSKKSAAQRSEPSKSLPSVDKLLEIARREKKNTEPESHPAPFVSALSQSKKDAIPTLLYERHDYNSVPGRSSVVINGKSLRVGANVGGGVKVEEILSDSVVLKHGDTQFRLRALNSWVNL